MLEIQFWSSPEFGSIAYCRKFIHFQVNSTFNLRLKENKEGENKKKTQTILFGYNSKNIIYERRLFTKLHTFPIFEHHNISNFRRLVTKFEQYSKWWRLSRHLKI